MMMLQHMIFIWKSRHGFNAFLFLQYSAMVSSVSYRLGPDAQLLRHAYGDNSSSGFAMSGLNCSGD